MSDVFDDAAGPFGAVGRYPLASGSPLFPLLAATRAKRRGSALAGPTAQPPGPAVAVRSPLSRALTGAAGTGPSGNGALFRTLLGDGA
jgi:hypothetical protein